jgi:hypothetical protein
MAPSSGIVDGEPNGLSPNFNQWNDNGVFRSADALRQDRIPFATLFFEQ